VRIAIVNDSPTAVEALRRVLDRAHHRIAWVARDGDEALQRCKEDRPDVLLMDLRMPKMNGAVATRRIMTEAPTAIIVVTSSVTGHYAEVYEAMGAGALDAVNTPVLGPKGDMDGDHALLDKIATVGKLVGLRPGGKVTPPPIQIDSPIWTLPAMVAIGASTGGPQALAEVMARFPRHLDAAVVIIQHVDPEFAEGLASWLYERSGFPTALAVPGMRPEAGRALIASTNDHLVLGPERTLSYTPNPRRQLFRPSVDVFFQSAAKYWPRPSIAVVLTGMGRDGAAGMLALRQAGWTTIAQDERSSVVYGMPKAAAETEAATEILPVDRIGKAIADHLAAGIRRGGRPR
jgi:two-component system, chemotaxis family, response regulator WspF